MRIVSLLPSATEMLFALGFDSEIVGVSHECDFPPEARNKSVVIHSRIPPDAVPAEIDRLVRDYVARGESVYAVDAQALRDLAPDLIVTQDLCHVCAASPDDLAAALSRFDLRPKILCLNPQGLDDVWRDILTVGAQTGRTAEAQALVQEVGARLAKVEHEVGRRLAEKSDRPRVAFLEWLSPLYVGGHWVPEMIHRAGGEDVLGRPRTASFRVTLDSVIDAAPEVLLMAPCGYSATQARDEYCAMADAGAFPPGWGAIPAVRDHRLYALEANNYFSRPGPRLLTGVEELAKLFHPGINISPEFSVEGQRAVLPIMSDSLQQLARPRLHPADGSSSNDRTEGQRPSTIVPATIGPAVATKCSP